MVKKTNRSGAGQRETRSQKKKKKRNQHFGCAPPVVHKNWNRRETLRENYDRMGVSVDANAAVLSEEVKEGYLKPELDEMAELEAIPVRYVPKSMDFKEKARLRKLIRKHGDDYASMARDIKRNVMQETAAQLKKRIELLHKLNDV